MATRFKVLAKQFESIKGQIEKEHEMGKSVFEALKIEEARRASIQAEFDAYKQQVRIEIDVLRSISRVQEEELAQLRLTCQELLEKKQVNSKLRRKAERAVVAK